MTKGIFFRQEIVIPLIFLVIAVVLLVSDRILRILPLAEGFLPDPNAQRCGVDMSPCPEGTRCMNGYCFADVQPSLQKFTGLPVEPSSPPALPNVVGYTEIKE